MVRKKFCRAGCLSVLVVMLGATAVQAQARVAPTASDLRIAAERFDEGRLAFKAGSFAEAAEHFEAADARAPSASALGLAMRSRAEAGQMQRAATLGELVLRRHADDAELAEKAKAIIQAAAPTSGNVRVACKPDCDLVVDDKLVHGRASGDWTLYLEPAEHTIAAYWPGDKATSERVSIAAGETVRLDFEPAVAQAPKPPEVAPPPAPMELPRRDEGDSARRGLSPVYFWIGVAATATVGGAAIWSGIDTLNNPGPDAVRQSCVGLGESCQLYRQGQQSELRTNILIGATMALAAASAVTGAFFTDFSRPRPPSEAGAQRVHVRPWFEAQRVAIRSGSAEDRGLSALVGAEGRF